MKPCMHFLWFLFSQLGSGSERPFKTATRSPQIWSQGSAGSGRYNVAHREQMLLHISRQSVATNIPYLFLPLLFSFYQMEEESYHQMSSLENKAQGK